MLHFRTGRRVVLTFLAVLPLPVNAAEHVVFPRDFAPQQGLVSPAEQPDRQELCLNGSWQFQPVAKPAHYKPDTGVAPTLPPPLPDHWDAVPIRIPSPWNINSFPMGSKPAPGPGGDFRCYPSYPHSWDSVDMAWMRRSFRVPADWKNSHRLLLHFNAVDGAVQVVINGKPVGEHFENFLPFEFDVTDAVKTDGDNELLVGVRKCDLFNQPGQVGRRPYVSGSMWGNSMAGIWQDVYLLSVPDVRVSDLLVNPKLDASELDVDVTVTNSTATPRTLAIGGDVRPWVNLAGKEVLDAPEPKWRLDPAVLKLDAQPITVAANSTATATIHAKVDGQLKTWTPDEPNLNGLTLSVSDGSIPIDHKYIRFGWRQLGLSSTSLLLNGKPIALKGDAWHFIGAPEMTRRYAWAWFQAIKAANLNAVRLHAQPYPSYFLDVADEQGIMVLDETGIWGSDGSPKLDSPQYWDNAADHLRGLVMRDRNHPCVLGYSVTNEVLVIMRNFHASQQAMDRAFAKYDEFVNLIHKIDPTRQWISGDGEDDASGHLPIVMGHYGGMDAPKRWSKMGKPWGVGECGMAYYGTPKQVSQYNGSLSYESMSGRLDGVAREAYQLITKSHQPLHAAYSSVFNVVWYGLHPLPFGLADTCKQPSIDDGIWFGPMKENTPGEQPERIGPYCMTLNPGYDPKLPMYQPWPLFDAIRDANAPGGPAKSEFDHLLPLNEANAAAATPAPAAVKMLSAKANDDAQLELSLTGVPFSSEASDPKILIVSGSAPPSSSAKSQVDRTLAAGGTVLVWRPMRSKLSELNQVLPMPLELNDRTSTSLLPASDDPLMSGLSPADFYFSELKPDVILNGGLAGPLVDAGHAVLTAPAVDWRRWNNQPEVIKTGSIARSEAESQPTGVAMSVTPVGPGRIIVCNLSGLSAIPERIVTTRRLLTNLGIALVPQRELIGGGLFTNGGVLRRALAVGRFPFDSAAQTPAGPGPGTALPTGVESTDPRAGMKVGPAAWTPLDAGPTLVFDLRKTLKGPEENAAAYVSFWVNSPRSLDDVLGEPDVPRVDLLIGGSDRAAGAWLNGKPLSNDGKTADEAGAKSAYPSMVLKRGWNHVLIRLTHRTGKWELSATMRCSDAQFLSKLQAALQPPM